MSSKIVVDAVLARMADQWTACPVYPPNVMWQPPQDASAFIAVQFPVANTERVAVNQRTYRETGAFRIVILSDAGAGADQALEWAEQIATIFRDKAFAGIRTQVPGTPYLNDDNDDGNYHRTSFAVPYTRDFNAA